MTDIHDIHVWQLSVGKPSMTAHLTIADKEHYEYVLTKATKICRDVKNII